MYRPALQLLKLLTFTLYASFLVSTKSSVYKAYPLIKPGKEAKQARVLATGRRRSLPSLPSLHVHDIDEHKRCQNTCAISLSSHERQSVAHSACFGKYGWKSTAATTSLVDCTQTKMINFKRIYRCSIRETCHLEEGRIPISPCIIDQVISLASNYRNLAETAYTTCSSY